MVYLSRKKYLETKKLLKKYSKDKVNFDYYYKYEFSFSNEKISLVAGGHSDDIYRASISKEMTVSGIEMEFGDDSIEITEEHKEEK